MTFPARQLVVAVGLLLAIAIVLGYIYFQSYDLIRGPVVEITSPENGAYIEESLLELTGTAKNITELTINDSPVFIDPEGNFKEELLLAAGYTILTIAASDRFGRTTLQTYELTH